MKNTESEVLELISKSKICKPMNTLEFKQDDNGNNHAWLNPNDQTSFNAGWYQESDFRDWLNGTGKIVKGKTEEEKAIYWEYANFLINNEHAYNFLWLFPYFNLLDESFNFVPHGSFLTNPSDPLKITKKNHSELIGKMFGYYVRRIKEDFKYRDYDSVRFEYNDTLYGVSNTLFMLGIGYCGASNTPTDINNLIWVKDLTITKAYYLKLLEDGIKMPDFDFIDKNRRF